MRRKQSQVTGRNWLNVVTFNIFMTIPTDKLFSKLLIIIILVSFHDNTPIRRALEKNTDASENCLKLKTD